MIDTSDVMQLENGCACCSASDELLQSLLKLLVVAAEKGEMYDRIVIESSGVSEPKNVRQTFFMNAASQHPAFDYAKLQNMVTVVDSGNFLSMYQSGASLEMRPHLVEVVPSRCVFPCFMLFALL
jgi:G3E family GTPase